MRRFATPDDSAPWGSTRPVENPIKLRSDALEWREIEGELVALDLRSSTYLAVNRTGTTIWPGLVAGETRDELVGRLAQAFDIPRAAAEADIDAFLRELEEQDLLERP